MRMKRQSANLKRKQAFTLLEVMLCIALISLMASAFAWKGNNLLQHYLLRSSAKTLVREIEAAHLLAMSYQTDIAVVIVKRNGDYFLEWRTDEPPLKKKCRPHKMRGVKNIRIDDYKCAKATPVAAFSSISSSKCRLIELEGASGDVRSLQLSK